MTTITPFAPPLGSVFSFQATLDGQQYVVSTPWGLSGQRWFVKCSQLNGTVVFLLPLIGSIDGLALESLSWASGVATAVTNLPHGLKIGSVVAITTSGCAPASYNGQFDCSILDQFTFSYALPSNPGMVTQLGLVNYNVNIAEGYFQTSTLIFRQSSQQFEVTP